MTVRHKCCDCNNQARFGERRCSPCQDRADKAEAAEAFTAELEQIQTDIDTDLRWYSSDNPISASDVMRRLQRLTDWLVKRYRDQ